MSLISKIQEEITIRNNNLIYNCFEQMEAALKIGTKTDAILFLINSIDGIDIGRAAMVVESVRLGASFRSYMINH